MSAKDWPQATDAIGLFRLLEKRLAALERRPGGETQSDSVGPGIAARAVELRDWDETSATYNGFFYSEAGALHAPETTTEWSGMVVAREDGSGAQELWDPTGTAEALHYTRTFDPHPEDPTISVFGEWKQFATHSGKIGVPELEDGVVANIDKALADAAEAMQFVDIGIRIFRQADPPVDDGTFKTGYVWYDTDDSDRMYRWSMLTQQWEESGGDVTQELLDSVEQAQAQADAALAQAQVANGVATAASRSYRQPTMPEEGALGWVWFDTSDPGQTRMLVHNGVTYVEPGLSLTGTVYQTDATPNRGIKISSEGLVAWDASGSAVMTVDAASGDVTLSGALMAGGSIDGATVTGGTVQSETSPMRGVKMTSSGLFGYDIEGNPSFALTGTGDLALTGAINAGSTIYGALIAGPLATTATPERGIKMTNSGLYAYSNGDNSAIPAGVNTLAIDATTGSLTMRGDHVAGNIVGVTLTGGQVQTSPSPERGIKMTSTGLVAYDSEVGSTSLGQATFSLDATTGEVIMRGSIMAGSTITGADFQTSTSGERIVIRNDGSGGVIEAYSGTGEGEKPALIDPTLLFGEDGIAYPGLRLTSGAAEGNLRGAFLDLRASGHSAFHSSDRLRFVASGFAFDINEFGYSFASNKEVYVNGRLKVGGGTPMRNLTFENLQVDTNNEGIATVWHSQGLVGNYQVFLQPRANVFARHFTLTETNANNFKFRVQNAAGDNLTGASGIGVGYCIMGG